MSPARDVLLGRLDGRPVLLAAHGPRGLGGGDTRQRRRHHLPRLGAGAVHGQLAQPPTGVVVGPGQASPPVRRLGHDHVVDQDDALAPMVEGGELADHHQGGIGMAQVVGRHAGQPLDLAHHVVAEIPDQPSVQRRQPVERSASGSGTGGLDGRQDPLVRRSEPQAPGGVHRRAARRQRGQGPPTDERVAAPALAALDRFEEEPFVRRRPCWRMPPPGSACRPRPRTTPGRWRALWPGRRTRSGSGRKLSTVTVALSPGAARRGPSRSCGRSTSAPRCGRRPGRAGRPGPRGRRRHSPCALRGRTGDPPRSRPSASTPGG